jgi:hypothetical protein
MVLDTFGFEMLVFRLCPFDASSIRSHDPILQIIPFLISEAENRPGKPEHPGLVASSQAATQQHLKKKPND